MAKLLAVQASGVSLQSLSSAATLSSSSHFGVQSCGYASLSRTGKEPMSVKAQYRENVPAGVLFRRAGFLPFHALKAASSDSVDDSSSSSGSEWMNGDDIHANSSMNWTGSSDLEQTGMVLSSLNQDARVGLVLREDVGTSWTTGSGLEGPTGETENAGNEELKFPDLSKSPRRKMRVAFTCNVCGERTIRAINPLAYTDGTIFVQCKGCNVFHKLVDNLNLFHEMRGKIYRGYDIPWYANDQPYDFLNGNFPRL